MISFAVNSESLGSKLLVSGGRISINVKVRFLPG